MVVLVSSDPPPGGPTEQPQFAFSERQARAIVILAAVVAAAVIVLSVTPNPRGGGARLALALVACGPMMLLRRWPLPVLGGTVVASGVVIAAGTAPLPLSVVLGFAVYLVASRLPKRRSISATLVAAACLGGALLYAAITRPNADLGVLAVEGLLPLAAAWFVGDAVAAQRRYQAGLAEQARRERTADAERARLEVREQRVRIAQELHDVVAHTLAVITVQAGVGRRLMEKRPEEAANALESIEAIGRTAQEELGVVLGLLREEGAAAADLSPLPRLVDLKELVETIRASGASVELRVDSADRQLSPALELTIYRVVQEALTNVVKHAPGAGVTVDVVVSGGTVAITVADTGAPNSTLAIHEGAPGHGLSGMRERVTAFGGSLVTGPSATGGFEVVAELPIEGGS